MRWTFHFVSLLAVGASLACPSNALAQQQPAGAAPAAPPAANAAPSQAAAPTGSAAQTPAPAVPDQRRMDAILVAWSKQTQTTQSLYAKFERTDIIQAWKDVAKFNGVAVLKSPNLAYLNFEKLDEAGQATPHERIVVGADRVYQFDSTKHQVHVYELARDAQTRALDEGPLPFLFNMNVEEARQRYRMALLKESEEQFLIAIIPLSETDKQAFSRAYIWLNRQKFQPDKIQLVDPNNGKDTKTYTILDIRLNVAVDEGYFDGKAQTAQVAQAKWDVVVYGPDGNQIGAPASTPATGPAPAQPAQETPPTRR